MNKLYIVLALLVFMMACGKQSQIDTDLVKAHTLHLEQLTDTTTITPFLKGVQSQSDWSARRVSDNRLLKYAAISVQSFSFETNDNDVITKATIEFFKESEQEDIKYMKKYLTDKFGQPEENEYHENELNWSDPANSTRYDLKIAEEGYSNASELKIYFKKGNDYNTY